MIYSGVGSWGTRTSEIPLRCCLRKRTVQEIRRGFLRWRKRDSDLPFWKRKILLSPRTYSLPCDGRKSDMLALLVVFVNQSINQSISPPLVFGTKTKTSGSGSSVGQSLKRVSLIESSSSSPQTVSPDRSCPSNPCLFPTHFFAIMRNSRRSVPFQGRSAGRRRSRRTFSL